MPRRQTALWTLRVLVAACSSAFGVFLLVRAWGVSLDGGSAMFTPLAFMGALVCFGVSVVLLMRQTSVPRKGRPAAR
jgi:hypothetical protein